MNGERDEVAEWLRRWTANPLCSARVGSNPIFVGKLYSCRGHRNPFKYLTSYQFSYTVFLPLPMIGDRDEVAEWLRRWTANPLCSARVGSNPILVGNLYLCRGRRNPFK